MPETQHRHCACFTHNNLPCCNAGHGASEVACPRCSAAPGSPCRTMLEGIRMMRPHAARAVLTSSAPATESGQA